MDQAQILEKMQQYTYGKFLGPDDEVQIFISTEDHAAYLKNFFQYTRGETKCGTCSELMVSAYYDLIREDGFLNILRVYGTDDAFFSTPTSTHLYLLKVNFDYPFMHHPIEDRSTLDKIIATDPLIIDPSYGVVAPYSIRDYSLRGVFPKSVPLEHSSVVKIRRNSTIPIGIYEDDIFEIRLNMRFKPPLQWIIKSKTPKGKTDLRWYRWYSPNILDKAKGTGFEDTIKYLQSLDIIYTPNSMGLPIDFISQ